MSLYSLYCLHINYDPLFFGSTISVEMKPGAATYKEYMFNIFNIHMFQIQNNVVYMRYAKFLHISQL